LPQKPGRVRRRRSKLVYIIPAIIVVALIAVGALYISGSFGSSGLSLNVPGSTSVQTTANTEAGCQNPPSSVTSGLIYAKVNTTFGTFEVELFPEAAPQTVANFVNLSKAGFYDNLVWHRIVPGFVIQTGDPLTRNGGGNRSLWGTGGSSKTVPLETNASLHNYMCYLGMARSSDPNSGSSQFYVNLANNTSLDGQYTVFGTVVSGMNVVNELAGVPVNSSTQQPVTPVYVTSVTVLSSGP
jgi:dolichyl-diphosphooligosaccharide---protein glycosyltransferase